ncbi:Ldh family oxidoreductase [Peribacillus sp. Bi134]|uniref:Ldh family oxidoreductase n=1 Tax=Peribacillus sp. Bi134 TaxID=2884272 RepID=UPI001D2733F0|nr:Ldh family oxidoreductase [Peribacillus sp. Bi134]CAH0190003.1 (2R)-3-sulfolactate dehydrogenase (NADP(+)) [Peribacillus sp. Bi134]
MKRYNESALKSFCEELLGKMGMSKLDSGVVADSLVTANMEGVDSHGISRLPIYSKRFLDNRINISPNIQLQEKSPSVLVVDGDNGLGHVISYHSILKGIEMAKSTGTAAIAIKNSNHFGTASYFCKLAAEQNLVCIGFTNSPPGIAPWGGKKAFFGTNPIAFGFPTDDDKPVIIDLSTSIVARGKIILAANQGKEIPEGWAIDREGQPTTSAEAALEGSVLPLGGAKGAALALAVEILTGVLSGAAFGPKVKNLYDEKEIEPANVGHFFILLDIEKFIDLDVFFLSINMLLKEMKAVPKALESSEIRYPGERRRQEALNSLKEGIQLPDSVLGELVRLGEQFDIPFPCPMKTDLLT